VSLKQSRFVGGFSIRQQELRDVESGSYRRRVGARLDGGEGGLGGLLLA